MFVKIRPNKRSKRRSVLICHNIRRGDKTHHLTIRTLGHSEDSEILKNWVLEAKEWIKENELEWKEKILPQYKSEMQKKGSLKLKPVSLLDVKEEQRINVGIEDVFSKLYNELGFQDLLKPHAQKTLRKVIFSRILEPGSKRRLSKLCENKLNEELPLDRIYRMMDALAENSDLIEKKIFEATESALEGKVSLVLFDVTTLSFESIIEDDLRAFGFSKDFKFNTTQVTLALATSAEGLPVGYRLFPGNTSESKTLIEAINSWKKHIPIKDVTVIGDRAMMSDDNLTALEAAGYQYIIAFPLRKLSKEKQALILDKKGYLENKEDNDINRYRLIDLGNRQLCVSYSAKRAAKDAKDRERLVNKLKKKLETCKNVKRLVNKKVFLNTF